MGHEKQMAARTLERMSMVGSWRLARHHHVMPGIGTDGVFRHGCSLGPLEQIPNIMDSSAMPFRDYTQFDSATLAVMQKAYDAVAARRNLKPTDPLTGILAATIAQLAAAGVTDLNKLTEQAASQLRKM